MAHAPNGGTPAGAAAPRLARLEGLVVAAPFAGAAAVFSGVLITTPPGFRAISDVLLGSPRGAAADAAAYALGAASSLALVSLLLLAALGAAARAAMKLRRRQP